VNWNSRKARIITFVGVGLLILLVATCIFHRRKNAHVFGASGSAAMFKVYTSFWGRVFLIDAAGRMFIIYPGNSATVLFDAPMIRGDDWAVLDPIRSLIAVDYPIALDLDPQVERIGNRISLNLREKLRVTVVLE